MFYLSETAANTIYSTSNIIVLIASIVSVCGAIGLFWSGAAKEGYAEQKEKETDLKIAKTNESAEQLKVKAASLEKEANVAKLELERIKNNIAPRVVTAEISQQIDRIISNNSLDSVFIMAISNDNEASTFADELKNLFINNNISVDWAPNAFFGRTIIGIKISPPISSPTAINAATEIARVFNNNNILCEVNPDYTVQKMQIIIGSKK